MTTERIVFFAAFGIAIALGGCASGPGPAPRPELDRFDEFDKLVAVKKNIAPLKPKAISPSTPKPTAPTTTESPEQQAASQPFPFPIGEKVVLEIRFSGTRAGTLTLSTNPSVMVSGRPAHEFEVRIRTSDFFSYFFKVNDQLLVHYDQRSLLPLATTMRIDEKNKLQESRLLFDWKKMRADEWEKTQKNEEPFAERHKSWALQENAQSVLSIVYHLRALGLKPGAKVSIPVSHDEKNFFMTAEALKRETISTPLGDVPAIAIHTTEGLTQFISNARGEMIIWLSEDDRRIPVRLEVPLRWGKLTAILKSLQYPPSGGRGLAGQSSKRR